MSDANQGWAPRPMSITIVDKGETLQVDNVAKWVEERKQLLRQARDLIKDYDARPPSLYPQYGKLVGIVRRLAEIKVIFDIYTRERNRHVDANIIALVAYFTDPKTLDGIDD
ncbi:hypothetical protein [Sphingomonas sp. Leaf62]|uniref:hypothetical protein n=1 Tax=Sphingomonas sp. Leaf62 TaxID=1736228 RepID=UPI0006FA708F|nr:hypothetical protein [Sphingomonas sp. Leaf62]KQN76535.1 hypothetical protein ASE91_00720 [Sphingomonas sp. Leaf62]